MQNNKVAISLIVILSIFVIALTGGMIYLLLNHNNMTFTFTSKEMTLVDSYSIIKDDLNKISLNLNSTDVEIKESIDDNILLEYYSNKDNNAKIEYLNNTISVDEEKYDTSCIGICNTRRKIVIHVPNNFNLAYELKLKSGDVLSNIDLSYSSIAISTMSGDVKLATIKDAAIATMSGDVNITKVLNSIAISTMSGDVDIESFDINEASEISTMSGDVKVSNLSECYIETQTKSGDIKISNNNRKSDMVLKINTTSGDIRTN